MTGIESITVLHVVRRKTRLEAVPVNNGYMNVPDNDRENQEKFLELLKNVDPDLAIIKDALIQTKIDPMVVFELIKAIDGLASGSAVGKIEINIANKRVQTIVTQAHTRFTLDNQ